MTEFLNLNHSLEEIEQEIWGYPSVVTPLVEKVFKIRKKPLKDLTVEDMRLMIGQQFSLDCMIPLALKALEKNPFVEGDFYQGDLLVNMLSVKKEFWDKWPELYKSFRQVIKLAYINMSDLEDSGAQEKIKEAIRKFDSK